MFARACRAIREADFALSFDSPCDESKDGLTHSDDSSNLHSFLLIRQVLRIPGATGGQRNGSRTRDSRNNVPVLYL